MSKIDLKEYLNEVIELETSIHCQQQIVQNANKLDLDDYLPEEPEILMPRWSLPEVKRLEEKKDAEIPHGCLSDEIEAIKKAEKNKPFKYSLIDVFMGHILKGLLWGIGAFLIMLPMGVVLWLCLGLSVFDIEYPILEGALYTGIAVGAVVTIVYAIKIFGANITYKAKLQKYEENLAKAKKEYNKKDEYYTNKRNEIDSEIEKAKRDEERRVESENRKNEEEYKAKVKLIKKSFELTRSEVNKLNAPIREAQATLEKLYSLNIIFPKYRNLAATCTILEYLESGRCDKLEGPDGAYNLFESELRQNLIISKLDEVIENLQYIQQNQFTLYQKLDSIDRNVSSISRKISSLITVSDKILKNTGSIKAATENIARTTERIAKSTESIALTSAITAQYSEITAKNTEAIKYLSLIS